jgi:hypothetical protein
MAKRRFTINRSVYDYVLGEVAMRIPFGNKELLQVPEAINREFATVPDDIRSHFKESMLRFDDGERWSVGDFWEKLRFGPYLLNYQTKKDLVTDFPQLIRTMVLIETITRKGYEEKLDKTPSVKRESRMWRDDLLAKVLVNSILDTLNIVESDLREFYQSHREDFTGPGRRRIRKIIVGDREPADALIDRIRAGEDMKVLANQYSIDATRSEDAEHGIVLRRSSTDKISMIAYSLPLGGLYGPIELDSTHFAIIRLEEIIKGTTRAFEEVSGEVKKEIRKERIAWASAQLLATRAGGYKVYIDKQALQEVDVLKGTMLVRKSHFPNRMAAPLAFPVDDNSAWFQQIWNSQ